MQNADYLAPDYWAADYWGTDTTVPPVVPTGSHAWMWQDGKPARRPRPAYLVARLAGTSLVSAVLSWTKPKTRAQLDDELLLLLGI